MADGFGDSCEIRVYDSGFNWVGAVFDVDSVRIRRDWRSVGEIEIHVGAETGAEAGLNVIGNVVTVNRDGAKSGVIRDVTLNDGENGRELTVFAETGGCFAKRRVVVPNENGGGGYDRVSGAAESVIKHYLTRHLVSPDDIKRKIPYFAAAEDRGRGKVFPWQARWGNLAEELKKIAEYGEVGWNVTADVNGKVWIADVIIGEDRTRGSAEPVVFRTEYGNVGGYVYDRVTSRARNAAYVGGSGTDENRLVCLVGAEHGGLGRYETFFDRSDGDMSDLRYYGERELAGLGEVERLNVDVTDSVFRFGADFALGDLVTVVVDGLGITTDAVVGEVTEVWERQSGFRTRIRLGAETPNLVTGLWRYKL